VANTEELAPDQIQNLLSILAQRQADTFDAADVERDIARSGVDDFSGDTEALLNELSRQGYVGEVPSDPPGGPTRWANARGTSQFGA
jgi:hypothetical protein